MDLCSPNIWDRSKSSTILFSVLDDVVCWFLQSRLEGPPINDPDLEISSKRPAHKQPNSTHLKLRKQADFQGWQGVLYGMMWETLMCFVFVFPTKAPQIPVKPSQWRLVVQSTAAPTSVTDIGWKWRFQPLQLKPMLKQLVGINLDTTNQSKKDQKRWQWRASWRASFDIRGTLRRIRPHPPLRGCLLLPVPGARQVPHTGQQWAWDISETTDNCCFRTREIVWAYPFFPRLVQQGLAKMIGSWSNRSFSGIFGSQLFPGKSGGCFWHPNPLTSHRATHPILGRVQALRLRSLGQGDGELPLLHLKGPRKKRWSEK